MEVLSSLPPLQKAENQKLESALSSYGMKFGERKLRRLVQEARAVAAFQEEMEKVEETVRALHASAATKSTISIHLPLYEDGDDSILDSLAADMESAEDMLFRKQILDWVRAFIKNLPDKEAKILVLRLGIDCEACSQQAVAAHLGLRRERVYQLERALLRQLRQFLLNRKAI